MSYIALLLLAALQPAQHLDLLLTNGLIYTGDPKLPIARTVGVRDGMSVFVPPFVKHEIVNNGKEPLEGVLVLYGDNSDFAFGTSYPAFMQDLNQFYRKYPFRKPEPRSGGK